MVPDAETSFARLSAAVPAAIGAAIATPEGTVRSFGEWSTGVAWSTIKVPLALAALRGDRTQAEPLLDKVITESDNSASEAVWSQLGPPTEAARKVQAVIEDAGDSVTMVESRRLRAGFTPFGQTQWSLARQAGFAARLPSLSDAGTVIDLMHRLVAAQRWGLAAKGLAAKGGWGPGVRGDYLVRQFGIVPSASGHVGVALGARAGSFARGVTVVNEMTTWVVDLLTEQ
jgi:hypothetical protein